MSAPDASSSTSAGSDASEPRPSSGEDRSFVETPVGIVTERGHWYHATADMLRDYAGEVFEYASLETLLRWADHWVEAPRTLALWALPALLWSLGPGWAVAATLLLYVSVRLVGPSAPLPVVARVIGGLRWVGVQGLYYVGVLSVLAADEAFAAVGVGLLGFIVLRWGLLDRAVQPLLRPLSTRIYPLPVTDQVLRGLIVRVALANRLPLPQLDDMASDILENWSARSDDSDDARPPPGT